MNEIVKYVLIALGGFFMAWSIRSPKQIDHSFNDSMEALNQKIDSINILIKKEDRKIDSIYIGLNYSYEEINNASDTQLINIMRELPRSTSRH